MAKVAVVIPCFNLGKHLNDAVESVLAQTLDDFEIVVVDDGSDDEETIEVIHGLSFPKTKVIRTPNRGPSAARNTGIRGSHAPYIICLDADDRLDRTYLEATSRVLAADSAYKIGIVSTWMEWFGEITDIIRLGPVRDPRLRVSQFRPRGVHVSEKMLGRSGRVLRAGHHLFRGLVSLDMYARKGVPVRDHTRTSLQIPSQRILAPYCPGGQQDLSLFTFNSSAAAFLYS